MRVHSAFMMIHQNGKNGRSQDVGRTELDSELVKSRPRSRRRRTRIVHNIFTGVPSKRGSQCRGASRRMTVAAGIFSSTAAVFHFLDTNLFPSYTYRNGISADLTIPMRGVTTTLPARRPSSTT